MNRLKKKQKLTLFQQKGDELTWLESDYSRIEIDSFAHGLLNLEPLESDYSRIEINKKPFLRILIKGYQKR